MLRRCWKAEISLEFTAPRKKKETEIDTAVIFTGSQGSSFCFCQILWYGASATAKGRGELPGNSRDYKRPGKGV